jgi:hypothetical protein
LAGFGVRSPLEVGNNSGYTPSLNCISTEDARAGLDGPIGFGAVGHIPRRPVEPSWISMFNEERPVPECPKRSAVNRCYKGRNLICLGFGEGQNAVQLYCDGGDGRTTHRHQAPLSLLLFAGGREVFPDQGYIGDHPANKWIKSTASHNTVVIDEQSALPATRTTVNGFVGEGPFRFVDIETEIPSGSDTDCYTLRRAIALIPKPDGLPILIDVFDVSGGTVHDYIVRVNDPDGHFDAGDLAMSNRQHLYEGIADPGPFGFQTAGRTDDLFTVCWGDANRVWAHILTPADEVITFKSPAWRNRMEVFEEPNRSWEALVLRQLSDRSRYVIVYEVGGDTPWIKRVDGEELTGQVCLHIRSESDGIDLAIGAGTCDLSR